MSAATRSHPNTACDFLRSEIFSKIIQKLHNLIIQNLDYLIMIWTKLNYDLNWEVGPWSMISKYTDWQGDLCEPTALIKQALMSDELLIRIASKCPSSRSQNVPTIESKAKDIPTYNLKIYQLSDVLTNNLKISQLSDVEIVESYEIYEISGKLQKLTENAKSCRK